MSTRWLALQLDVTSSTPLYLQLTAKLTRAIHAGKWQASEALPSERSLAEHLSISRVTARKALELLRQQGLIGRHHGSGSFITPQLVQSLSHLFSFSEMLRAKGFKPVSVWLARERVPASIDEMLALGLPLGSEVWRLKRQRQADGVVMSIEITTIPAALLPDPQALGDSLYAYLEQNGHAVRRALQHVRAINADEELARLAGIALNQAMLLVTRIGYDQYNRAIELSDSYCRNDYYDYVAELTR